MIARRDLLLGLAAAAAASGARAKASPRDLNGFWSNLSGTQLERPAAFKSPVISEAEAQAYELGGRKVVHGIPGDDTGQDGAEWFTPDPPLTRIAGQARTSIVVDPDDGKLPYSPAGRKALIARLQAMNDFGGAEGRPIAERCLLGFGTPAGAPIIYTPQTNGDLEFIETAHHFVIRGEANNDLRIVSLDAQPPPPAALRPWMGVSTGRREGPTLVVETSRFHPDEGLRHLPYMLYLSPEARVTERFTRISPREVLYDFRVEDAGVFTRPWRGESLFRASSSGIYEYACHEGNYSLPNILAGARRIEAQQRAAR